MEDIEDMFKNEDDQIDSKRLELQNRKIMRKALITQSAQNPENPTENSCADTENCEKECCSADAGQLAPGTQNIFVKTYGCSHNISDSEYMAGLLANYGYKIVDNMEDAHACLLNSCTVKNPS
jgi:threonylcarbamoyladenosine tRNA methylthiotransferase CDKAL1